MLDTRGRDTPHQEDRARALQELRMPLWALCKKNNDLSPEFKSILNRAKSVCHLVYLVWVFLDDSHCVNGGGRALFHPQFYPELWKTQASASKPLTHRGSRANTPVRSTAAAVPLMTMSPTHAKILIQLLFQNVAERGNVSTIFTRILI